MTSPIHTVIVELLETHPDALTYLLEIQGTPPPGPLVPTSGTRTKTFALERRVDRAFVIGTRNAPTAPPVGNVGRLDSSVRGCK